MEAMGDDEQTKRDLASQYSDVYKEKHGIRPRWMNWEEKSVEELKGMLEDLFSEPDMVDDYDPEQGELHDIEDEMFHAENDEIERKIKQADEEKAELERMQEPEKGEEFPGHEGMGRRHPLEETLKLVVMEVLAEAKKAKKYKGKSMRPGGGGRFAKLVDKLKSSGKSEESAKAIAAAAGREKYGAAKMKQMAKAGKKRAAKK